MHITRSLTVSADPAAVFEWIEDPQLASQWQPDVAEYAITKASPDVVGTEFRETLRSATGSKEMHGRITAYEPNTRMEFHIVGSGIRVRISYLITAAPPGTRLDVDADIHLGGRLSWLLEPLTRRKIARQMNAELAQLRDLCEETAVTEPA